MTKTFILGALPDSALNAVLSMSMQQKSVYFSAMISTYYPNISQDSEDFNELIASYMSSFYAEKLYRSNLFFNEKFTVVYTQTGLIRNIIADMYYADDDLITH